MSETGEYKKKKTLHTLNISVFNKKYILEGSTWGWWALNSVPDSKEKKQEQIKQAKGENMITVSKGQQWTKHFNRKEQFHLTQLMSRFTNCKQFSYLNQNHIR